MLKRGEIKVWGRAGRRSAGAGKNETIPSGNKTERRRNIFGAKGVLGDNFTEKFMGFAKSGADFFLS
jgi:hypothetical protein